MTSMTRTFRSPAGAIVLILVLRSVSQGILGLALPLYFDSIGRSAGEWGLASGAFALAVTFAEPAWGWASDRMSAATPFLAAGLGSALLAPMFALTGHPGALLAVQFGRGWIEFASSPLARKALAHSLGPGGRGVGIGLFQACGSAGGAVGPLLGGYLLRHGGYAAAFLASSASSLLAVAVTLASRQALACAAMPSEGGRHAVAPEAELVGREGESLAGFAALASVAACVFAGTFAGRSFVPLLGTTVLELDATRVALVLSATGALAGPLTIAMGRLSDRWGRKPLIVGGLVGMGVALLGYAYLRSFAALAACTLLISLGFAAAVPAGVALVADLTPFSRQGRMIGLYGACENVGLMLGPLACGFLWDAHGPRLAFAACALFAALGIVGSLFVREKP